MCTLRIHSHYTSRRTPWVRGITRTHTDFNRQLTTGCWLLPFIHRLRRCPQIPNRLPAMDYRQPFLHHGGHRGHGERRTGKAEDGHPLIPDPPIPDPWFADYRLLAPAFRPPEKQNGPVLQKCNRRLHNSACRDRLKLHPLAAIVG